MDRISWGPIIAFFKLFDGKREARPEEIKSTRSGGQRCGEINNEDEKTKTKGRNNWKYFVYCFGNINSLVVVSQAEKIIEILIETDRVSETKEETWDLRLALNVPNKSLILMTLLVKC